jgi:type IX secretion system PorP/SprF family membrane protein
MLGQNSLLSAGFNVGWVSKSIQFDKLTFPDQFNGHFFDGNLPTGSVLTNNSVNYPDIQIGLNYSYFATDEIYLSAGYSMSNVTKPKASFLGDDINGRLDHKHTCFLDGIIKTGRSLLIKPSLLYANQAGADVWNAGALAEIKFGKEKTGSITGGLFWRNKDAIIPAIGIQIKRISIHFSYDITQSDLRNYNNGAGANEFSLMNLNNYGEKPIRELDCPH